MSILGPNGDVLWLAATYIVMAGACSAIVAIAPSILTPTSMIGYLVIEAFAIGIFAAEAAVLACWASFRKNSILNWLSVLITLMLMCYAFAIGPRLSRHDHTEFMVLSIRVGTLFFVAYAYVLPIAIFWQLRLEMNESKRTQSPGRQLTISQMFVWTLAVAVPFGVWRLFVPDERDGTKVLTLFLVAPLLLLIVTPVFFASFARSDIANRLYRCVFWFVAIVAGELSIVAALTILMLGTDRSFSMSEFRTYVFPNLLMVSCIDFVSFLLSMFSALWLRRCGYRFAATCQSSVPSQPNPVI